MEEIDLCNFVVTWCYLLLMNSLTFLTKILTNFLMNVLKIFFLQKLKTFNNNEIEPKISTSNSFFCLFDKGGLISKSCSLWLESPKEDAKSLS